VIDSNYYMEQQAKLTRYERVMDQVRRVQRLHSQLTWSQDHLGKALKDLQAELEKAIDEVREQTATE
jgi:predicted transcriptional regulator